MRRIEKTVDELYISSPYFTTEEARLVKGAAVFLPKDKEFVFRVEEYEGGEDEIQHIESVKDQWKVIGKNGKVEKGEKEGTKEQTVEDAIKFYLSSFLEKRKASGDSRPCGPHDLAPVYEFVFGISKEELSDEGFLRRVRRQGLGLGTEVEVRAGGGNEKWDRKASKAKDMENWKGNIKSRN